MSNFNTNVPDHTWTIENKINFWKGSFWHNIEIKVHGQGKEAEYKCTMTFQSDRINEEEYWLNFGKKVAELMENIDLARRIESVKK
jgi:hypothetical protein